MYIEPNSTIKLLTNVPLDPRQTDTLWFANANDQYAYFNAKTVRTFSAYSYQRKDRGYLKVEAPPDSIYHVNYMMFRNTSYSSKWFYAFVLSVEYVNDATAYVRFQIDPIQTWFFDYTPEQCFIERMHSASDDIGEHIEPEPCETGEYVMNNLYEQVGGLFNQYSIVLCVADPTEVEKGEFYDNIYSNGDLFCWDLNGVNTIRSIQAFIDEYRSAPDSILDAYMVPTAIIGARTPLSQPELHIPDGTGGYYITPRQNPYSTNVSMTALTGNETIDGYHPRNNKMYTYPYNFYRVETETDKLNLRYEFFDNLTPRFKISGNLNDPVALTCKPIDYANSGGNAVKTQKLTINNFPICSWGTDYYKAWLAQNSVPLLMQGAQIATGLAANTHGGEINTMAGLSSVYQIGNIMGQMYKASIAADITKGNIQCGNNDFSHNRMHFSGARWSVPANLAERIDDFFTMFGYALGKIETPKRHNRSRFTYVKTVDCKISGNVPADDLASIEGIYDNGIRFWADTSNVGYYGGSNAVLS